MHDPHLEAIIRTLKTKYKCHTALLYGSRARDAATETSDYDVLGISRTGKKTRIAKKVNGAYWDVFVFPEKDLTELSATWRNARVLFERGNFGRKLILRIEKFVAKPFVPAPAYEIAAARAWPAKQFERIAAGDAHGNYRRLELLSAALGDYFQIRRKRFWGPKAGLAWLEENDRATFKLFSRAYAKPTDMRALKALVTRVYKL